MDALFSSLVRAQARNLTFQSYMELNAPFPKVVPRKLLRCRSGALNSLCIIL